MEYIRITDGNMDGLKALHIGYKQEACLKISTLFPNIGTKESQDS